MVVVQSLAAAQAALAQPDADQTRARYQRPPAHRELELQRVVLMALQDAP